MKTKHVCRAARVGFGVALLVGVLGVDGRAYGQVAEAAGNRAAVGGATTKPVTLANPWKWKAQLEGYAAADAKEMPAAGGIVFVGSSSVRIWDVKGSFGDLPVLGRGLGGCQSSDIVFFFDKVVLKYRPRVVVVYVGSNDMDGGRSGEMVVDNLGRFAEMLKATLPEAKLIVMAIKPSPSRLDLVKATAEANVLLNERAKALGFVVVDPVAGFLDAEGKPRAELYREDKLHYNTAGYAVVNAALGPVLRAAWAEVGGGK